MTNLQIVSRDRASITLRPPAPWQLQGRKLPACQATRGIDPLRGRRSYCASALRAEVRMPLGTGWGTTPSKAGCRRTCGAYGRLLSCELVWQIWFSCPRASSLPVPFHSSKVKTQRIPAVKLQMMSVGAMGPPPEAQSGTDSDEKALRGEGLGLSGGAGGIRTLDAGFARILP